MAQVSTQSIVKSPASVPVQSNNATLATAISGYQTALATAIATAQNTLSAYATATGQDPVALVNTIGNTPVQIVFQNSLYFVYSTLYYTALGNTYGV
jgi:hypothetical protein